MPLFIVPRIHESEAPLWHGFTAKFNFKEATQRQEGFLNPSGSASHIYLVKREFVTAAASVLMSLALARLAVTSCIFSSSSTSSEATSRDYFSVFSELKKKKKTANEYIV